VLYKTPQELGFETDGADISAEEWSGECQR